MRVERLSPAAKPKVYFSLASCGLTLALFFSLSSSTSVHWTYRYTIFFHNSILNADMLLEWEISLFSFKIMSRLLFIESISSDTTYIDVKRQCYTASGWKIYVRIFLNICLCLFVVVVCLSGKILG